MFEKSLKNLEKIVAELEGGQLPLDKSLAQFESGIKLIRDCQKALQTAEQKVQILTKDKSLEDFDNANG